MILNTYMSFKQALRLYDRVLESAKHAVNGRIDLTKSELAMIEANGSIVKLIMPFIIEPTIVVSKSLREEEVTEKLMNINLDVFTSFYMQAFQILSDVHGMNASAAFDILSTNKSSLNANNAKNLAFESLSSEDISILPIKPTTIEYLSAEATSNRRKRKNKQQSGNTNNSNNNSNQTPPNQPSPQPVKPKPGKSEFSRQNDMKVSELNKAFGIPTLLTRTLEMSTRVKIDNETTKQDITVKVPITVKAKIVYAPPSEIYNLIEVKSDDKTFMNRLDEYRSGGISLSEFLFATDLVKDYKENKFKDKSDLIKFMDERATASNKQIIKYGHKGLNRFYGILLVDKTELNYIEKKVGGSISKPKFKDKLMNQTGNMLVTVIDRDWERATIYIRDLSGSSDISFKTIKKINGKSDGSDMAEIFKAVVANKPPVF